MYFEFYTPKTFGTIGDKLASRYKSTVGKMVFQKINHCDINGGGCGGYGNKLGYAKLNNKIEYHVPELVNSDIEKYYWKIFFNITKMKNYFDFKLLILILQFIGILFIFTPLIIISLICYGIIDVGLQKSTPKDTKSNNSSKTYNSQPSENEAPAPLLGLFFMLMAIFGILCFIGCLIGQDQDRIQSQSSNKYFPINKTQIKT